LPIPEKGIWADFVFLYFPNQLPVFAFGILLYHLNASLPQDQGLRHGTLLLVTLSGLVYLLTNYFNAEGSIFLYAAGFLALALGLRSHAPKLLVNPVLNHIGEVSFSLYLVHFGVLFLLRHFGYEDFLHPSRMVTTLANTALRFTVVLGVSVGLATVFYYLIEVPFQNVGKRLIKRLEN